MKFLCKLGDYPEIEEAFDQMNEKVQPYRERREFMIKQLKKMDDEVHDISSKYWDRIKTTLRSNYLIKQDEEPNLTIQHGDHIYELSDKDVMMNNIKGFIRMDE